MDDFIHFCPGTAFYFSRLFSAIGKTQRRRCPYNYLIIESIFLIERMPWISPNKIIIDPTAQYKMFKVGFRAFKSPYIAYRVNSNTLRKIRDEFFPHRREFHKYQWYNQYCDSLNRKILSSEISQVLIRILSVWIQRGSKRNVRAAKRKGKRKRRKLRGMNKLDVWKNQNPEIQTD